MSAVRPLAASLAVLAALAVALALQPTTEPEPIALEAGKGVDAGVPARIRAPTVARKPRAIPSGAGLTAARAFAADRAGEVSFAVVDTQGRLWGVRENRLYSSASVVKAMLLAAELRRVEREGLPLDAQTESLLRAMITYSDNDAADAVYGRVGDAGLFEVARLAGMSRFEVAGHWGNAQVTAADMARMFSDLEGVLAGPRREFGLGLLGSIIPEQSWGIPAAAGRDWAVRFKGGWVTTERGQLAHQAAELSAPGMRLAITVLTDYQPSMSYATETVQGVTERLLDTRPAGNGP